MFNKCILLFISFFICILGFHKALATGIYTSSSKLELVSLKISSNSFNFIIIKRKSETTIEAIESLKSSIQASLALPAFDFHPSQLSQFNPTDIKIFDNRKSEAPHVLILANRGYDLSTDKKTNGALRIDHLIHQLNGSKNYVLVPYSTLNFSQEETLEAHQLLIQNFDAMIALGGADISPELYSETNLNSRQTLLQRDKIESEIIKSWISAKRGLLIGICRGHQLIASVLGFKLAQHIDNHGDGEWTTHPVQITSYENNPLKKIFNSQKIMINSYHHQSVLFDFTKKLTSTFVTAYAEDGTVEGLSDDAGLIFTTQFHFEFLFNEISQKIFSYLKNKISTIKQNKTLSKKISCSHLFN